MRNFVVRFVSLLLALLLAFSACTVALAEDLSEVVEEEFVQPPADTEEVVPEEIIEEEVPMDPLPEITEQPQEDPSLPEAEPQLPLEEELEQPLEEEPVVEEPVFREEIETPTPLFAGLPEGYVLSEAELEAKALLTRYDILGALAEAQPGIDYEEGQLVLLADTLTYAEMAAQAYGGSLLDYQAGVAIIQLGDATVAQAVEAAADLAQPLPAAEPNWISYIEPIEEDLDQEMMLLGLEDEVPTLQSWESWYYGLLEDDNNSTNPDTWLKNPNYYENNRYQWMHDMVNSYQAWGSSTGRGITVAVIDSGVNANHYELKGKVTGLQVTAELGTEPYGNHGTHVAGIIAAKMGNSYMGAGIAPDADILSLKVVNSASGKINNSAVLMAVNLAIAKEVDVINMSLGGYYAIAALQTAIDRAVEQGIVVVAAMGNDGTNIKCYPGACDNVISVSAVDKNGVVAEFSNYGSWGDVSAPGVSISSTFAGSNTTGGWMSGTSQATPVVSGVVALYLSRNPNATPEQVEEALVKASTKAASSDIGGIVDAAKLFEKDKTAPVISVSYEDVVYKSGSKVPFGAILSVEKGSGATNDDLILISLNGKNPAVKDDVVTNGFAYDPELYGKVSDLVLQQGMPINKSVTLKAACVNGQGVLGKVASFRFSCGYDSNVTAVNIAADDAITLQAGKNITLTAWVEPEYANPAVEWTLAEQNLSGGSVAVDDQSGKLTASADAQGTVVVQAIAENGVYDQIEVTVARPQRTEKVVLDKTKLTLSVARPDEEEQLYQLLPTALDADGAAIDTVAFRWTSSKSSVVRVDQSTGALLPAAKGSAVITCRALDGSGKYAKCTVTVTQPVEEINLSGNSQVVKGRYTTLKAEVLPKTASNKKLTWSVDPQALAQGVKVSASGRVTVPNTFAGEFIEVSAASADGMVGSIQIQVLAQRAASVVMQTQDERAEYNSKGLLTKATIYSVDIDPSVTQSNADRENIVELTAAANNGAALSWTSSNPKIATVEVEDGRAVVQGRKAGTVKITATAQDGSQKKAYITLKVVVPASGLTLYSTRRPAEIGGSKYYVVSPGKSLATKASLSRAYGKPTSTKVTYRLEIKLLDIDTGAVVNTQKAKEIAETLQQAAVVKLSSSGQLSVNRKFEDYWFAYCSGEYDVAAEVTGTTADGAATGSISYAVAPWLTSDMAFSKQDVDYHQQELETVKSITMGQAVSTIAYLYSDSYFPGEYTFTSSNPSVVGVAENSSVFNRQNGSYKITIVSGKKTGRATITAKPTDGSSKTIKLTVTVA